MQARFSVAGSGQNNDKPFSPGETRRRTLSRIFDKIHLIRRRHDARRGFAIRRRAEDEFVAIFLVAHGAWSAGWAWKKMHPLIAARGHQLVTPTLTGLGERAHLSHPGIDLESHIADILAVIECEDLRAVQLIGHSYGGMVATGVADRARDRIATLIYLDAFAPRHGESAFDLLPKEARDQRKAGASESGWQIPPGPMPPDTPEQDRQWAAPRRRPQPVKTFEQKLDLKNGALTLPRHYIYCSRRPADDRFRTFYERARREGWGACELDASHNPHITAPEMLADLLHGIATR
jgi:pimeloyl-ACP methyl ester carboxylesterase